MLYMLVKMSSGWVGKEINDVASVKEDIQIYAEEGNIVVIIDDVKTFAAEIKISIEEIEIF